MVVTMLDNVAEEEKKRKESGFAAVGFTYSNCTPAMEPAKSSNLSMPEHLSTSYVDHGDEDTFIPPAGLRIPEGIKAVSTIEVSASSC